MADHSPEIQGAWSEQDTTPAKVEAALRELLADAHTHEHGYVPARVLNTVIVGDRQFKGEIANRLERVGRYHPSRAILVAVEPRRTTLDAFAQIAVEHVEGGIQVGSESVKLDVGEKHLAALDAIVDPLLVPDLTTLAWSPHSHDDAVDSLRRLVSVVLIDSVQHLNAREAIVRAADLAK